MWKMSVNKWKTFKQKPGSYDYHKKDSVVDMAEHHSLVTM